MAILHYTDRSKAPPDMVFCDASFVLDVYAAARPVILNNYTSFLRARAKNAASFFAWAKARGTKFVLSLLVMEEVANLMLFAEVKSLAKKRGLNWKQFRSQHPTAFQAAL